MRKRRYLTEKHKRKIGDTLKRKYESGELIPVHLNKPLTEEHKRNISNSNKGKITTEVTRQRISIGLTGKEFSTERKQKLSMIKKQMYKEGRIELPDRTGSIATPESNMKRSNTWKQHFADGSIIITPELARRRAETFKRKVRNGEIILGRKGKHLSEETKRKISKSNTGKKRSPEVCKKFSLLGKGRISGMKGRHHTVEARMKLSMSHKGQIPGNKGKKMPVEFRLEMSKRSLRNWQDPEYVKKRMKSRGVRPNKPELQLQSILQELVPNEYKYVGDGEFILAGKCPDFMNINGQKKLIELYGDYWHKGQNPQDRIDLFKKYGYDTLVIWESDLGNIERLQEFHKV